PDSGPDQSTTLSAATLVTLTATITDKDGDANAATLNIGQRLNFEDDGPAVNASYNIYGFNTADPLKGTYDFTIGADGVGDAASDGVVLLNLSGTTGGGRAITNTAVAWASEDSTSVTFNFSFKYYSGPASTQQETATGTVTFNKLDGSYVFDLNEAISGQVTFSTSAPLASSNYDTEGNNSPEIVVQKYSDNFYGVLSAKAATPPSDVTDLLSGGDHVYTAGETFTSESAAYVNVATSTVGVNSDTVQNGELLNFDFYAANPVSSPVSPPQQPGATIDGSTPKAYATAISITLDQITKGEDVAILLKLYNADFATNGLPEYTTKLLIADRPADYLKVGSYKVVNVTENNYDSAHYQIYGVQVLSSTENITGTGYSLSNDSVVTLTAAGSNYADTSDSDVFKIIKIDVTTESKSNFDTDLQFTGQVIDGDSDSASFSFTVHLEADSSVLVGTSGTDYLNGTSAGDTMDGGMGNDTLTGNAGNDIFRFSTAPAAGNLDTVSDFVVGQDKIALLTSVFTLGGNGVLDAGEFANLPSGSEQAGAYLVFNQSNQTLYYDADGAANGNAVAVVTLTGVTSLAESDLQFYS
ncbi:MAG: M10 family metallopeptidase C-terminal domain-containing protein, partial [Pseudogulbenkiania sp.]|nr:M10 family metallopeptidase C-terminal domain-containing protein [Pseudogulbenkiania sp.]